MIGTWRQQQARQSYLDGVSAKGLDGFPGEARVVDEVIEVATTVKITQEAIDAFSSATAEEDTRVVTGLTAALTALGFEVVK